MSLLLPWEIPGFFATLRNIYLVWQQEGHASAVYLLIWLITEEKPNFSWSNE